VEVHWIVEVVQQLKIAVEITLAGPALKIGSVVNK
jgi:hypothetical protein